MNFNFKKLPPFKWFVLQNFPFIEADFDSITYYQLLCKLAEEINKVINSNNSTGQQVELLTEAYNELQSYVEHYFDNLDVQDEINNKLDEMAEGGQLADIIAQYLQLAGVLAYNTLNDMKNATNLTNGSIVRTLGTNNYLDGYGNYYKIRYILNTDVVDNINIIALANFNNLIAEKIPDNYIVDIYNTFGGNRSILLSDSYFDWSPDETIDINNRYWKKFFDMMNITNYYAYNKGGIGFYQKVDNENFLSILQNHYDDIQNKDTIKNIFVFGGYNDAFDDNTTIQNINDAINDFVAYCKTNYPNAKVYIGEIGYDTNLDNAGTTRRNKINNKVIPAYCNTTYNSNNPYIYLPNLNYCLHNKDYMSTDGIHPNTNGHNALANAVFSAFNKGFECLPIDEEYINPTPINNATVDIQLYVKNTPPSKVIRIEQFTLRWDNEHLQTFTEGQGVSVANFSNSKTILPVYDIHFCTFGMVQKSDDTYEILPVKIMFAQNGDIVINAMKLNSSSTSWENVSNVKYLQIWPQELATTMNVL